MKGDGAAVRGFNIRTPTGLISLPDRQDHYTPAVNVRDEIRSEIDLVLWLAELLGQQEKANG